MIELKKIGMRLSKSVFEFEVEVLISLSINAGRQRIFWGATANIFLAFLKIILRFLLFF